MYSSDSDITFGLENTTEKKCVKKRRQNNFQRPLTTQTEPSVFQPYELATVSTSWDKSHKMEGYHELGLNNVRRLNLLKANKTRNDPQLKLTRYHVSNTGEMMRRINKNQLTYYRFHHLLL
jgi:hypothetical protein